MAAYAGIGSRQTPESVLWRMEQWGYELARQGKTLRTGGAEGADTAFEKGALRHQPVLLELYLPWPGFGNRPGYYVALGEPTPEAYELAAKYHPAWDKLKPTVRRLIARNGHQVLGKNLDDPVEFVYCWTPGGKGGGGTGQALRIAQDYGIPIVDLGKELDF